VLGALRRQRGLGAALRGVNAVVVGILAAALISPVGTTGIRSPATAVIAASGFAGLVSGRVPPLAVVAGSALAMGCLAVVGIS
jgi:chromate transporter